MKAIVVCLSLGLGSWSLGIPAWAQAVLDTSLSAEIFNQPVTTPFRRPGLLRDSSRPVYVITRQQMREQGARTVQEALRYLPGILSDGTAGTQLGALSSQFMRGARTAQVLVLLDGRPLNDLGFFGGFDLSQLTTDIVERIEVSPGGGSTLYGSDAVGGVINIVTVEPQPETETVLEAAVGSYGLNEQGIQSRGQAQDLGWVLSYRRLKSNNDFPFAIERLGKSGKRENSAVEYHNLQAKLTWQLAKDQVLTANALYLNKAFRVPGSVEFPSPDAEQNTNDLLLDLSWLWTQATGSLQARVFFDDLNYRFSAPQSQGSRDVILRNGWGSQLQYAWQAGENLEGALGVDYRSISARNTTFSFANGSANINYDDTVNQGALFARLDYSPDPNFHLDLGMRQDFSSLANGSATSPAVGIRWTVAEGTTLRANYASSFRTPLISELFFRLRGFFEVDGNPNLRPERGESFDVGLDQSLGDFGLLRLTFAHNRIRDGITFVSLGPRQGTYENIGLVEYTGLEAALDLRLGENWTLFANYTLNDPIIRAALNPATVGKQLAFVGADSFNLGLTYRYEQGGYGSILIHHIGSFFTNNSNTESLPGYTTVALRGGIPLTEALSLELGIDNLLDEQYEVFPGYPGVGRTLRVSLRGQF
ncbi:TonB-dependent receptor [Synechococcus sp. H60.2]|uniref:TonB-dependent receptor plug domain-containing protein n=1 Tax=Synechococcus sp. H60.2 TaxID=2964518 RepID=UPI0039C31DEC